MSNAYSLNHKDENGQECLAGSGETSEKKNSYVFTHLGKPIDPGKSSEQDARPLTVHDAALYLGVSRQTVYLWVERKQIPHLRVMGRNIRFLRSDLELFRAQFRQTVEWDDQ